MADHITKYATLARKLYENTSNGMVHWQLTGWQESLPTAHLGGYIVKLSKSENDLGGPVVSVSLFDNADEYVDGFTDETLVDQETSIFGVPNFWQLLNQLYNAAWRYAKGADKALDAVLKDLDDTPF